MKLALNDLRKTRIDKLIVESVDLSLYIAHAEIGSERYLIAGKDNRPLKTQNLLDMKTALASLSAKSIVLSHRSSYDEMVGHEHGGKENLMELPLSPGFESLPAWLQ